MPGVLATTILVLGLVGGVVVYNLGFYQRAEIEAVTKIRVFFDAEQTSELKQGDTLNWGIISSGVWTMPLYINNTGNAPVILGFNYRQDQLPGGWAQYWDYDSTPLAHHEVRIVTITLVLPQYVDAGVREWESWITATPIE